MRIEYSKDASKFINALDKPTKKRIKVGIESLTNAPPQGDIKVMQKYKDGTKRLRIGKFRIIYRYEIDIKNERVLFIANADSCGAIYK